MELSRRDALAALAATGVLAGGAGCSFLGAETEPSTAEATPTGDRTAVEDHERATLLSLAEVLYPSEVEVAGEFIDTYMYGRIRDEASYREELAAGVETLDAEATEREDAPFRELDAATRDDLLSAIGVRRRDPDPDGTGLARVHYYLVNELLFALYSSPTGGELVGLENPRGWPGGLASYQRGPQV